MGMQYEPNDHWSTRTRKLPTPLDGAYCNALLLVHWSVRQKVNHVSSGRLRRCVRAFRLALHYLDLSYNVLYSKSTAN